jgi:hypothetical protein
VTIRNLKKNIIASRINEPTTSKTSSRSFHREVALLKKLHSGQMEREELCLAQRQEYSALTITGTA